MPYATALTLTADRALDTALSQNAMRFHGRVAVDAHYNGLALDAGRGRAHRARACGRADVAFLGNHGVVVCGARIDHAYDDLYYLERACMAQVLAQSHRAAAGAGRRAHWRARVAATRRWATAAVGRCSSRPCGAVSRPSQRWRRAAVAGLAWALAGCAGRRHAPAAERTPESIQADIEALIPANVAQRAAWAVDLQLVFAALDSTPSPRTSAPCSR